MKRSSLLISVQSVLLLSLTACGSRSGPYVGGGDDTSFCNPCKLFITQYSSERSNGNLGGIAGADAKCSTSVNKPAGDGVYKALLVDGDTRRACGDANCSDVGVHENIDWVLHPNTLYTWSDGTTEVMTTNEAGIFVFGTLTHYFGSEDYYWSGLRDDWTTSTDTCDGWTNGSSGAGNVGTTYDTDSKAIYQTDENCNNGNVLLVCVEQ